MNDAQSRGKSVDLARLDDCRSSRDQRRYCREKRHEYRCDDESTNFHPLNVKGFASSTVAPRGRVELSNLPVKR